MTTAGWILMLASWATFLGMFVYCIVRTLASDKNQKDG